MPRDYTCWCDGDCDKPVPKAFSLCSVCSEFGHGLFPRMGLTEDDLRPADPTDIGGSEAPDA